MRHKLSSKKLTVGAIAVSMCALAAWAPTLGRRLVSNGTLERNYDSFSYCFGPPTAAEWAGIQRSGQRFGLDVLSLSSDSAHVTVTKVDMIDPTPGFELMQAAFVPIGGVGIGSIGKATWSVSDERLLTLEQELPARLKRQPQAAKWAQVAAKDARDWQLAVRVRVPPNSVDAHVAGFRVTYRSGWLTRTLTTKDTIRIGTTKARCGR